MNVYFSVTPGPVASQSLALRAVYRLEADRTYDAHKRGVGNRDIVALRTTAGLGLVTVEGCPEVESRPGTLMFFQHDRVRRYYCAGERWDFWWFEFSSGDLPALPLNRPVTLEAAESEYEDAAACLELLGRTSDGARRLASAAFAVLLSKWLLRLESGDEKGPHARAVEAAVEAIRLNIGSPLCVRELARAAGLCERRFRQVFLEHTGMQPKRYHEALRIGMAEELLSNTPLSVGAIAERLGYSSPFHFSKAFRAARGVPPSAFRAGTLR